MANPLLTEPLATDSYRPYGTVVSADRTDIAPTKANQGTADRFNRLGPLENLRPGDATANLCVFRSQPFSGCDFSVQLLERHEFSTQLFVPLAGVRRYLVVVALGEAEPDLTTLRAFIARGDQGITYSPGVWHHPLIALDQVTDFACVVFENGAPEDCKIHRFSRPIEITLGS
jgi:ureidoglycolate lyase